MIPMDMFVKHYHTWKECRKCSLCEGRTQVIFARGTIPCDVLYVGEAPGVSEDSLGQPFIGPAGILLDKIVRDAEQLMHRDFESWNGTASLRNCFTNLVGCIPLDDNGRKAGQPEPEEISKCQPKLVELIEITRPKMVVSVGDLPGDWMPEVVAKTSIPDVKLVRIVHPAYILRANVAQRSSAIRRAIVVLKEAMRSLYAPVLKVGL